LLRAGVRIAEWSLGMMHAKAAAVDGRWATVGSYNLDHRSLRYNLEVTANVFDAHFAGALELHLAGDFARSGELDRERFRRRPWCSPPRSPRCCSTSTSGGAGRWRSA